MLITSQMIRDIVYFNGPMSVSALLLKLKAVTPEDRAEIRTKVKLVARDNTWCYNAIEDVVWVTEQQFKSCK